MDSKFQTWVAGIDPGLDGWYVVIDARGVVKESWKVPTLKVGKKRTYHLAEMVRRIRSGPTAHLTILEKQQPFKGQGVTSTFSTGYNMGLWEGILSGMGIPYELVHPIRWKNAMGIIVASKGMSQRKKMTAAKNASVAKASKLHPDFSLIPERCRVPDHNLADALLLAWYGLRIRNGEGA